MSARPDWAREGARWPNAASSRFVEAAGLKLHVQVAGNGPVVLLVHGAGGATHSWRDVLPRLAERYTVVAPDLPGHGFSAAPRAAGLRLPAMAGTLAAMLRALGLAPALAVGHSAGAAVAIRMALDGAIGPAGIVSINGALKPFRGSSGIVYPALARLVVLNPVTSFVLARAARDEAAVARVIRGMGSEIDPASLAEYALLMRHRGHVEGAIGMMAQWDLKPLVRDLPRLETPIVLMVGERDRAIPPGQAREVAARVPRAEVELLTGLGHLAHEEAPERVAARILYHAGRLLPADPCAARAC